MSRDDDHLSGVEAVEEGVEVEEAGGDADGAAFALEFFEFGDDVGEVVAEECGVGFFSGFHDAGEFGLGGVVGLPGGALAAVADFGDAVAGFDDAAADGAVTDDLGVVLGVGGGGDGGDEFAEVDGAADFGEDAEFAEVVADGDLVGGLVAAVHVGDGAEHGFVLGAVEVFGGCDFEDFADGAFGEEHAAEDALFGVGVLGWYAFEGFVFHGVSVLG